MQLKSIGEIVNASSSIKSVIDKVTDFEDSEQKLKALDDLREATKKYSLETVKGAISQSTAKEILTKETIKEILAQQGLQGELLETTADELANVVSTNAVATAQRDTTKSTHSLGLAFKGLGSKIKSSIKNLGSAASQLTTLPVGLMAVVAAVGVCVGGFAIAVTQIDKKAHKYIEQQQKIIDSTSESIEKRTEEISKLEDLKKKFDETASSGGNFANIYEELNDSIGATPGLLKGESAAIVDANAKLEDRIALLKEEKELEEQKRKRAIREKYNNNVISNKGGLDPSLFEVRGFEINWYGLLSELEISDKKKDEIEKELVDKTPSGTTTVGKLYDIITNTAPDIGNGELYSLLTKKSKQNWHISGEEFNSFLKEQNEDALDYVSDIIDSYDGGIFTESAINDLIYSWTSSGETLLGIENKLRKLLNNKDLHKAVDNFYASFNNPDIDTNVALEEVENQLDLLKSDFPVLKSFVDRFYAKLFQRSKSAINSPITFSDIFSLKDSNGGLTKLGELSEQLDNIQNAYKTLSDAMNEYQTNGSYSVDTLQKIMELGDDWLDYLVDENGELKLDTEAVEDLASARLNEMKIRVQNSLIDRIKQIENEADANGYLASTNYTLADSISAVAKSEALESLQNTDLSDKKRAEVIEKFEKEWEILNNLFDNTSAGMSTLGGIGMSSVMSDISSCAGLISNVNKELSDNGEISFNTLQSIADKYPELEKYVNNYMGNVEGAQGALVEALKARYQTELDNYYDYCANKMAYDSGYWKNVYNQLPDWIKKLAETYKVDLENCSRYGDAKEKILENINEAQEKLTMLDNPANSLSASEKNTYRSYWNEYLAENQALLHEVEAYFDSNVSGLDEKFNNLSYIAENSSSDSSSNNPQIFDWIETRIDRLNTHLDSLKSKADDVYSSWGSRTKSLDAAIQTTTEAIDLQGKAYDCYMQEADSVGLPEPWAKLVRDGKIDLDPISDENITDKINEYQNWYNKAQDCLKTQEDLKTSLNELNRQKFDGIQTRYEDLNSTLEHASEISQAQIDLAEARGLFANSSYYKEMIALTKSEISNLEKEKKELTKIQDNVPYGTEAWYDMQDAINGIDKQLQEAGISIVGFNNSIRSLNWEIFEYLEESLNRITDEAGFFIDLMSNEKLFDDKGFMTGYADASMALHAANYDVYRQQAQDYYKEVQTLEKQLAKGAGKEVLEQYNSMVDAHRSAVNAAEDEKQAILDLMEDGYNAQLDALDRLIDKKKEQLSAEKNLYDYQKSISEKTDNIASLEKQNSAYADDDSEDAMARIQRIKVELEEAKADLKETEYEKYLSDTETMLDRLSEDYEGWIKERLDNEEALLTEVVKTLQEKGAEITGTLNEIANKYGTYISDNLSAVFNTGSPFTTSLTGGIDTIAGKIDGVTAAVNSLINRVSEIVNVNTAANSESNGGNKNDTGSGSASKTSGSSSAANKPASADASSSAVNTNVTQGDGIPRVGDRVKFVSGQYYATEYGTGNTGNECLGQEVYITKIAAEGTKRYHIGRTSKHGQRNLGWVNLSQLRGYRKGTKAADDEWAWTQEEGSEILYRRADKAMLTPLGKGDMIWNNESTKRLWEIANDPNIYNKFIDSVEAPGINMPQPASFEKAAHMNTTASIEVGDINISLPNVTNYEDFRNSLIKDGNFEKSVLTMVNNAAVGKSTLGKMRFCR